jgi:hypothetical protein
LDAGIRPNFAVLGEQILRCVLEVLAARNPSAEANQGFDIVVGIGANTKSKRKQTKHRQQKKAHGSILAKEHDRIMNHV